MRKDDNKEQYLKFHHDDHYRYVPRAAGYWHFISISNGVPGDNITKISQQDGIADKIHDPLYTYIFCRTCVIDTIVGEQFLIAGCFFLRSLSKINLNS